MIKTFLATLNPILVLFICIVLGFVLSKTKILPEFAGSVMAKLEVWVFCPALNFYTMAYYCTIEKIGAHASSVIIASLVLSVMVPLACLLSRFFVRQNVYSRNVYKYAFTFSNHGYMGDPLVEAVLGGPGLAFHKVYTLPMTVVIYTWGSNILIPHDKKQRTNLMLKLINAPMVALILGIIAGLTGAGSFLIGTDTPTFFGSTLVALKSCMGPVAMLLVGITIARYSVKIMLTNVKVYIATILRMIVLPAITVAFVFVLTLLAKVAFNLYIDNLVLHIAYFTAGCPLGLNTVVFPEAYGGDSSTGASMAMVSHTACVVVVPLMYALLCVLFPL